MSHIVKTWCVMGTQHKRNPPQVAHDLSTGTLYDQSPTENKTFSFALEH